MLIIAQQQSLITYKIFSDYRTFMMGIAMISIIIFHYTEDSMNSLYNYSGIIRMYKKTIGSSGVDLFLLLSGLGLVYSMKKNSNIKLDDKGLIVVDNLKTSIDNIYAGGDIVTGSATVISAMEQGKLAAKEIMDNII